MSTVCIPSNDDDLLTALDRSTLDVEFALVCLDDALFAFNVHGAILFVDLELCEGV